MEIYKFPHPSLFTVCKEVTVFGPELLVLLEAMWETMVLNNGIGLASNQVGLKYRMLTMLGPKGEKLFIVNPKIVKHSKAVSDLSEGCLSAPGESLKLYRPTWVTLEYQDATGAKCVRNFVDIHAIATFHEIDHLDGKSYLQHKNIPKKLRMSLAKKWNIE